MRRLQRHSMPHCARLQRPDIRAARNDCTMRARREVDRDPLFCHSFRDMLKNSGVRPVRLPSRSPNLNAYAERWIGSVRRECLAKVIPLGERHLRKLVSECVAHYHAERNHQRLGNKLIVPMNYNAASSGRVERRKRLGGVLNYYYREAA